MQEKKKYKRRKFDFSEVALKGYVPKKWSETSLEVQRNREADRLNKLYKQSKEVNKCIIDMET